MTRTFIIVAVLLCGSFASRAQLKGIFNKVKNKTDQAVDKKIDSEIDKAFNKPGDKSQSASGNPEANASTPSQEDNGIKSFSRYDFIPGDSIIYAEDFQQEALGELPANWNTSGTGEVTTLDKYAGQWLRLHKSFTYLSSKKKEFGENYTLEFDMIL